MANSVYSEVTAVPTGGFERDRVLDKLKTADTDLPFSFKHIKISHNDFAISDVYNDSIRKLYSNYLFLIANAEMTTKTSPTTGDFGYWSFDTTFTPELCSVATFPVTGTSTPLLSGTKETHIAKKTFTNDSNDYFLYFNYSPNQSIIFESTTTLSLSNTLLSGNYVEFNKTFKFKNVVSVDTVDNLLFVLDQGLDTVFKFDIAGLITNDPALKRTGINDLDHPGRYLLKTIGGQGLSQTKNKLLSATCLSVHDDRVYILDNGHNSLKVFDLDFNFIHEFSSPSKFNDPNTGKLVSIVVDEQSDTNITPKGYILSKKGKVLEYDVQNNVIGEPHSPFDIYDTRMQAVTGFEESKNFTKIVNSKSSKNILYISNNKNIFKFYKTNFNLPITTFDFSKANFILGSTDSETPSANEILSFDSVLHNDADYLTVTTTPFSAVDTNNVFISPTVTYVFGDKDISTKLYHENFYTNYFSLSDILVLPQETVSNITFNKTTKKLIYNHFSLFENLNKKVYSYYNDVKGMFLMPTLCTINYKAFDLPSNFTIDSNFYIGVNEPLLTDVVNRPLELLYNQQVDLFNLIKEESLNNNPPSNIPARLPGQNEHATNVLSLTSIVENVSGGTVINIGVKRENDIDTKNTCSFSYYTTLGTAVATDFDPFIDGWTLSGEDSFSRDETLKPLISIGTKTFFTGDNKTFSFIIKQQSNCVIDPTAQVCAITLTPRENSKYTLSLSGTSWSVYEGNTVRVGITRNDPFGTGEYLEDSIVNIAVLPFSNIATSEYAPHAPKSSTYAYTIDEDEDFSIPIPATPGTLSAGELSATSTLHFTAGVSSLVFDLSAQPSGIGSSDEKIVSIELSNPSDSATLGTNYGLVRINEELKTIHLFLSSISATYESGPDIGGGLAVPNMLSCVNIWEALSASTAETNTVAWSAVSATNPVSATFTVHSPLSVFSVSAVSGALQFDAPNIEDGSIEDFVYLNNGIEFIVEDGSALVGKGGQGGHGALHLSGFDFTKTTGAGSGDLSASNTASFDGGPAINNFDTYFKQFIISNSGAIYGGAGGGSGGLLGVSATSMAHVSSLSAGAGGGGGAGIHLTNCGSGGHAAIHTIESSIDVFEYRRTLPVGDSRGHLTITNDGSDGQVEGGSVGPAGVGGNAGGFKVATIFVSDFGVGTAPGPDVDDNTVTLDTYPAMAGLAGGGIGLTGETDSSAVAPTGGVQLSWTTTLEDQWKIRAGGAAGLILDTTSQVLTTSSTGTFSGSQGNIV